MKNLILFCALIASYSITYSQQPAETVTDIDGNVYKTIKIGTQIWMAENLKTTKYNTGAPIMKITSMGKWGTTENGNFSWYNDDEGNKDFYGALYNWWAVDKGNLAPKGWHIPSLEEWQVLVDYLGGKKVAGDKLKAKGTDFWNKPNTQADNSTGFTAMPNGYLDFDITKGILIFRNMGESSYLWSSTSKSKFFGTAEYVTILANKWEKLTRSSLGIGKLMTMDKNYGLGIRCIKD